MGTVTSSFKYHNHYYCLVLEKEPMSRVIGLLNMVHLRHQLVCLPPLLLCSASVHAADCIGKGTLGQRFAKNLQVNDQDGNGVMTNIEFYNDFSVNYDNDPRDGCCSLPEWLSRWETYFRFSAAYATKRLVDIGVDVTSACPVRYSNYLTTPQQIPEEEFLRSNI